MKLKKKNTEVAVDESYLNLLKVSGITAPYYIIRLLYRNRNKLCIFFRRIIIFLKGKHHRIKDENFIEFDKYRNRGAYHWQTLENTESYRQKLNIIKNYLTDEKSCLDIGCGPGTWTRLLLKMLR